MSARTRSYGGNTFSTEGFDELREGLDELADDVATKTGRKATREGAKLLLDRIRERAPVGDPTKGAAAKYGTIRDNLKVRLARARTEGTIVYKITTGNAFWARFFEYGRGLKRQVDKRGHRIGPLEPHPFIRPAVDAAADAAVDRVRAVLAAGIEKFGPGE